MALEQIACTKAMAAACECFCDLAGLEACESDLRGALLLAARTPNDELLASFATSRRPSDAQADGAASERGSAAASPSRAGPSSSAGCVAAEEEEEEEAEEGDAEEQIIALQEQKDTLQRFIKLLEKAP
jgi:hypothetical protein